MRKSTIEGIIGIVVFILLIILLVIFLVVVKVDEPTSYVHGACNGFLLGMILTISINALRAKEDNWSWQRKKER